MQTASQSDNIVLVFDFSCYICSRGGKSVKKISSSAPTGIELTYNTLKDFSAGVFQYENKDNVPKFVNRQYTTPLNSISLSKGKIEKSNI